MTQPAVSAQIKRLQFLLGYEVFDKRTPGVSLTPRGAGRGRSGAPAAVHQRRNPASSPAAGRAAKTLRVGIPGDYSGSRIPVTLARFRLRWPDIGFSVSTGTSDNLLRELQQDDLDVILAVSITEPAIKPRHAWKRKAVWVRSDATRVDPQRPVPLVCYGDDCACQRAAVDALHEAGRECEVVFTSRSLLSLVCRRQRRLRGHGDAARPRAQDRSPDLG